MNVTMCLCLSTCRRIEAQEKALQQEATALQEKIEAEKRKAEAEQQLKMEAEQREQQQREQQLKMEAELREQQQREQQQREQQLREQQLREQQLKMEEQAKEIGGNTFSQIGAAKFSPTPMLITQSPKPSTFKVTISQPANQPKRSNSNSCLLNPQTVYPQNASHPKLPTVNHHVQAWGTEVVVQEAATKAGSPPKSTTTRSLILEPTASKTPPSPKAPALASSGALAPTIPLRNQQSRQSDLPQDVAQAHSRGSAPQQGHPRIVSDGACVASQCSVQP